MPRVLGVDIPDNKRLEISLTYIYGIGLITAKNIITVLDLNPDMRARELTSSQIAKLNSHIQNTYSVEGDLKREVRGNISRLQAIKCYRGQRHARRLPVRGQQTQTNARTRKGPKRTMSGKKRAPK